MNKEGQIKVGVIILISLVLLSVFIASADFKIGEKNKNIKEYNQLENKVKIKDKDNKTLIEFKRLTPQNNYVIRSASEDKKDWRAVACYSAIDFDSLYNVSTNMEFYDLKKGEISNLTMISQEYEWRYKKITYVDKPNYYADCDEEILKNGTIIQTNCELIENGKRQEQVINYIAFNELSKLNKSDEFCLFTYVAPNEHKEYIPYFADVRVEEDAEWTEGLNVNLTSYWKLEENSASYVNEIATGNNCSLSGTPTRTTGFIDYGQDFTGNGAETGDWADCGANAIPTTFSVNFWYNPDVIQSNYRIIDNWDYGVGGWRVAGASTTTIKFELLASDNGEDVITSGSISASGGWYMITLLRHSNNTAEIYINGTQSNHMDNTEMASSSEHLGFCGISDTGVGQSGYYGFNGQIDEVGIWERTLSQAEITQLYNSGSGMTYSEGGADSTPPVITPPTNATLEYLNESLGVDFDADETIDTWLVNETGNFSINSSGYLTNISLMSLGTYVLNISANDTAGNVGYVEYQIDVTDTINPSVTVTSPTSQNYTSSSIIFNVTATDLDSIDSCWFNLDNGDNISLSQTAGVSTDTGYDAPSSATSVVYGSDSWSNPTNVFASDNVSANAGCAGSNSWDEDSIKIVKGGLITGDNLANTSRRMTTTDTYYTFGNSTELWGETWTAEDINSAGFGVAFSYEVYGAGTGTHYLNATDFGFSIPAGSVIDGIQAQAEVSTATCGPGEYTVRIDYIQIIVYYSESSNDYTYTNSSVPNGIYTSYFFCNDSYGNLNNTENVEFIVLLDATNPEVSNLNWITTGGFTDDTLSYNQVLDVINVTASDTSMNGCFLTVTNPSSTNILSNATMTNSSNNWNYSGDITLSSAGNWTLTTFCNDTFGNSNQTSDTIIVSTTTLSLTNNWYGYAPRKTLNVTEISNNANYGFIIYEFEENMSDLSNNWETTIQSINNSYNQNVKVGLNYILDYNINDTSLNNLARVNISSNMSDLLGTPYTSTVEYISLEIANPNLYNDTQKYSVLNELAENITDAVDNNFVVFSKNYNSVNLDSSYIQYTTLIYSTPSSEEEFINNEISAFKNNVTLNRIYEGVADSLKDNLNAYYDNVLKVLRSTPNITIILNDTVASLINGDVLVFNNGSSTIYQTINVSNVSGILGKDAWDSTHNYLIENNSDLNLSVETDPYNATIVFFEDLDHIQLSSNTEGNVYKGGSGSTLEFNYSDGTRDGSWSMAGAYDMSIELFDPNYVKSGFMTYYGWINTSSHSTSDFCDYSVIVLADSNNPELDNLVDTCTSTKFHMYISVADYKNTQAWVDGKEAEVDAYLVLNESLHIFIDGMDTGVGGVNFTSRMKDLTDYVKITKDRDLGLNTYTAYEQFATWGDWVMKESCVQRWNGVSVSNPDNYTRENWTLELEKSQWYNSHNVNVLCQAFGNRTNDGRNVIINYTDLQNVFFASKVLGYGNFSFSQPDFQATPFVYVYDVGNDLSNSWSTDDDETYYRRYSNGIVYYNSSSEKGWIEDGRVINNAQVCFDLYDDYAGSEPNFEFTVNDIQPTGSNEEYSVLDFDPDFTWGYRCVDISNETMNGRFLIEGWVGDHTVIAGQGMSIGYAEVSGLGSHSWYDSNTQDSYTAYPKGRNWRVNVSINDTKKASIDTTSKITQTNTTSDGYTNITLSSDYVFNLEIWSNPIYVAEFNNLTYWNSTAFVDIGYTNNSNCDSNNPTWTSTVVNGNTHKACIEPSGTGYLVRVATPHLSEQIYQINSNNNPTVNITNPIEDSSNTGSFYINWTTIDQEGSSYLTNISLTNSTGTYLINTSIIDSISNVLFNPINYSGDYNLTVRSCENTTTDKLCGNDTINISISDSEPIVTIVYPLDGIYGSHVTELNYTVTGSNLQKCWYSINNGTTNSSALNYSINFSGLNSVNGRNTWFVYCNDTLGNVGSNYTSFTDNTNPAGTGDSGSSSSSSVSGVTIYGEICVYAYSHILKYGQEYENYLLTTLNDNNIEINLDKLKDYYLENFDDNCEPLIKRTTKNKEVCDYSYKFMYEYGENATESRYNLFLSDTAYKLGISQDTVKEYHSRYKTLCNEDGITDDKIDFNKIDDKFNIKEFINDYIAYIIITVIVILLFLVLRNKKS